MHSPLAADMVNNRVAPLMPLTMQPLRHTSPDDFTLNFMDCESDGGTQSFTPTRHTTRSFIQNSLYGSSMTLGFHHRQSSDASRLTQPPRLSVHSQSPIPSDHDDGSSDENMTPSAWPSRLRHAHQPLSRHACWFAWHTSKSVEQ